MSCSAIDLSPARQDIIVFKGGSIAVLLQALSVNQDGSDGPPIDLTGWTGFEIVVFDQADPSGTPLARYSADDSTLIVLDALLGELQWNVSLETISAYTWQSGSYYFRGTDPDEVTGAFSGGAFALTWEPSAELGQAE